MCEANLSEMIFRALDELSSPFGSSPPAKMPHGVQKSKRARELSKQSNDQMIIVRMLGPWGGL